MSRIEEIRKRFEYDYVDGRPDYDDIVYLLTLLDQDRQAFEEISHGKGRFSQDQFEHCRNTIEDMKEIAKSRLEKLSK